MTEEIKAGQIIEYDKNDIPRFVVDGVDVSECGFLDVHHPTKLLLCNECNSDFEAMECKDYTDCYYKQLKRLEQENQELGKIINCKNGTIANLAKVRDELKEENTKLKEVLEKIKVTIEPCKANDSCFTCKYDFCSNYEIAKIIKEVS